MADAHDPAANGPHDILAAEAFAVGAGDPALHHEAAHDVLAADEFPLPAAEPHAVPPEWQRGASAPPLRGASAGQPTRPAWLVPVALLGVTLVFVAVRRRRRARG